MRFMYLGLAASFFAAVPAVANNILVYEISSSNSTADMTASDVVAGLDWAADSLAAGNYKTGRVSIHSAARHISTDYTWKGGYNFDQGAIYCDNGWNCDLEVEGTKGKGPPGSS